MTQARERTPDHDKRPAREAPAPAAASPVLSPAGLAFEALGNRALLGLLRSGRLQRKTRMSAPGDPLEQEADRAADFAVSPAPKPAAPAPEPTPPPIFEPTIDVAGIPGLYAGYPLNEDTRGLMESRFGESFSDVRVHTGYRAAEAAEEVRSRAFTVGENIVFAEGEFAPDTTEGMRLLAHELAHVVQQRRPEGAMATDRDAERDAREAAHEVASGGTAAVRERAEPGTVQRQEEPFKSTPVFAWAGQDIGGGSIAIFAQEPGRKDQETVGFLHGTLTVFDVFAYEHGGDSGHEILTVSILKAGTVSKKDSSPTKRWPSVELHTRELAPMPKPEQPEPKPVPKPVPGPIPQPKVVPPKQLPAPPAPEPQPVTPEPEPAPLFFQFQTPATAKFRETLAANPSKSPDAASKLTDKELADLTPDERLGVIRAIADHGNAGDTTTLFRLISTTPDADAGAVQDALKAGNDKLLADLRNKVGFEGGLQLEFSMMDLSSRRSGSLFGPMGGPMGGPAPQLDLRVLMNAPPRDPREVQWLGDPMFQPSWTRGLKYWTDARGNTNVLSPELGLTTFDMFGKRVGRVPHPDEDKVRRALRGMEYLASTGGKRYVEGKGMLDEAAWQQHIEERQKILGADAGRELGNLERGIQAWGETQGGFAYAASVPSHLLGGRWFDEPDKMLKGARQDVRIALREMEKARTPEELAEAERHLKFATSHGERSLYVYKEDVYQGGEHTITGIKVGAVVVTAYVSAPVLLTYGGGAVTFKLVAGGVAVGSGLSAARQGVQIWEGSRKDFSFGEVGQGGLMGGALVFVPEFAPLLVGMGVSSSAEELSQGHYATGTFDMATSLAPFAIKGAPSFGRWARPRAAAVMMRIGAGTEAGMGGGYSYGGGIPGENIPVLVLDASGRPVGVLGGGQSGPSVSPQAPVPGPQAAPRATGVWQTAPAANAPYQPYGYPVVIRFTDPVDAAFAPGARYDVGSVKSMGRVRTTASGRQLMSLDAIALNPAQREAAKAVHGQTMAAAQQSAWQNTTNPREQQELAQIRQLWNQGTPQSQQQARVMARAAFDRHRGRYWAAVRANASLRAAFEAAGMRFTGGNTSAPVYDLPDGTVVRMTLEHSTRLADNPERALSGDNLQFVLNDENSVMLEFIRANDPFQR